MSDEYSDDDDVVDVRVRLKSFFEALVPSRLSFDFFSGYSVSGVQLRDTLEFCLPIEARSRLFVSFSASSLVILRVTLLDREDSETSVLIFGSLRLLMRFSRSSTVPARP